VAVKGDGEIDEEKSCPKLLVVLELVAIVKMLVKHVMTGRWNLG
jgi:hypothetical protein